MDLDPEVFTRPEALQQRIIGMDDVLLQLRRNAVNTLKNAGKVTVDMRREALDKVQEIDNARMILGVPPRAYTQKERDELPVGTTYLWLGKQRAVRQPKKDQ
jgi:Rod binding domain-containing protein